MMMTMIPPAILRFVKSVRLQRGVAWRAVRLGVVVGVVLVWAWVYLVSSPAHTPPTLSKGDWSSRSPALQVAAPISGGRHAPPPPPLGAPHHQPRGAGPDEENIQPLKENGIHAIESEGKLKKIKRGRIDGKNKRNQEEENNPRYHRGQEEKEEEANYREDKIIPKIFPQRRIMLPGDTRLRVEEEEDEEEEEAEEEGKWKGRNNIEKDNNHAMEELDEAVGIGGDDDNDENKNNDDDFVEEDVGGEEIKKKRQRREKPQNKPVNEKTSNNDNENNNNNNNEKPKNDLENHHHDLEDPKQGHRSQRGHNAPLPGLDLVAVQEVMRGRSARVKQVCARYGLGPHARPGGQKIRYPPTPSYETFYIDRGARLAWCPVFKAASTSWLHGFLGLAGVSESYLSTTKEQVSTVARRVWPSLPYQEAEEAMGMCVKAMVVRHPFERLASAFRDKLERVAGGESHGTAHYYQKYGTKIVQKYRKQEKKEDFKHARKNQPQPRPQRYSNALDNQPVPPPPPPQPPPPQRYKHVIDESQPQSPPQHGKEPTFAEFVQYLIDTDLTLYSDDHWMPYHLSCTPCLLDFDVIAKFETLDRDQAFLLRKTNLEGKLKLSWRHLTKGNRTADVVKRYFADVPKKHLLALYAKYRLDFEMFDYSVDDYLGYVSS